MNRAVNTCVDDVTRRNDVLSEGIVGLVRATAANDNRDRTASLAEVSLTIPVGWRRSMRRTAAMLRPQVSTVEGTDPDNQRPMTN